MAPARKRGRIGGSPPDLTASQKGEVRRLRDEEQWPLPSGGMAIVLHGDLLPAWPHFGQRSIRTAVASAGLRMFADKISGSTREWHELDKLLEQLRKSVIPAVTPSSIAVFITSALRPIRSGVMFCVSSTADAVYIRDVPAGKIINPGKIC
ncbi:hypothetical protein OAN307_63p00600 (plasmid) [Octadecabacter antarcticus 307]|uniref:Uncharacterized protein n=1 Tax=Octadecabacter antarcticus 307 TaxID=391626 RepID=M9RIS3_9RHOB|nr:hypothetical protein OAN307_63p00600 [Octadecabacter antarcticus 307]